jgi:hypothetical protein
MDTLIHARTLALAASALVFCLFASATAGFVEYKQDQSGWESAVGRQFTTLDFNFGQQVLVTDQYLAQGALFTDGNDFTQFNANAFPNDGWGLLGGFGPFGTSQITVQFTQPMHWIAVDHPGSLYIELFSGGQMIYSSSGSGYQQPTPHFMGIVSDISFDRARIVNPFSTTVFIDNLYFGAPIPAPGAVGLLGALGLLPARRRRMKGCHGCVS